MTLKRRIDDVLERWFANPKPLPLLLKGARQIGKTAAVRHFASAHYEQIVEVNFIEQPKFKHITDDGYDAQSIVNALSRIEPSSWPTRGSSWG